MPSQRWIERTASIEITTSYDHTARKVKVEVADNGCGVPHRYKMKIFEPYFSTKINLEQV